MIMLFNMYLIYILIDKIIYFQSNLIYLIFRVYIYNKYIPIYKMSVICCNNIDSIYIYIILYNIIYI